LLYEGAIPKMQIETQHFVQSLLLRGEGEAFGVSEEMARGRIFDGFLATFTRRFIKLCGKFCIQGFCGVKDWK
jgi:hypothetical protein